MEPKETRTGRTGRGNASGRSSPGSKLKTETSAKKASGRKLQAEKASQVSAGEKLRHDKAVFDTESDIVEKGRNAAKSVESGRSHGRKTPSSQRAVTLVSDQLHHRVDEDSDDNAGIDAVNRSSQFAEHAVEDGSNAVSRWRQKQAIKKEYAAAKSGQSAGTAAEAAGAAKGAAGAKGTGKAAKETKNVIEKAGEFVANHKGVLLIGGGWFFMQTKKKKQAANEPDPDADYTDDDEDYGAGEEDDYDVSDDEDPYEAETADDESGEDAGEDQ